MDQEQGRIATAERRFGQRVRAVRTEQGRAQQDIADALAEQLGLHLHQTAIAKIEAGSRAVKMSEALAIAAVLGVHIGQLLEQSRTTVQAAERAARADELTRAAADFDRLVQTRRRGLGAET